MSVKVFGLPAIARLVGLDEPETLRRLRSGELPFIEFTKAGMPIGDRDQLRVIARSQHIQHVSRRAS
jgi:hypothetical protein